MRQQIQLNKLGAKNDYQRLRNLERRSLVFIQNARRQKRSTARLSLKSVLSCVVGKFFHKKGDFDNLMLAYRGASNYHFRIAAEATLLRSSRDAWRYV